MPFLHQLDDWCREAVAPFGTPVTEWPGWQTRGRSGGVDYESGRPWCIMWHHTASSDQTLEDYHATQSDNAPVCNLDIKSSGEVVIIAAGPTNTNGKGSGTRNTSKGTVPVDSMNSYALGIEFYNNGVGGAWPRIQIDVGFAVVTTILRKLGLQPTDLFTHEGYAPDRKVDPATAAAVQGLWTPRSKNSSGSWNDGDLRAENVARSAGAPPPEEPPEEDDEMMMIARAPTGSQVLVMPDGRAIWWESGGATVQAGLAKMVDVTQGDFDRLFAAVPVDVVGDDRGEV